MGSEEAPHCPKPGNGFLCDASRNGLGVSFRGASKWQSVPLLPHETSHPASRICTQLLPARPLLSAGRPHALGSHSLTPGGAPGRGGASLPPAHPEPRRTELPLEALAKEPSPSPQPDAPTFQPAELLLSPLSLK